MKKYSSFFETLYDENLKSGYIGRGCHFSILRSIANSNKSTNFPCFHDICVIWDEDHDTRIIRAIEILYSKDLLSPISFIGERKGMLACLIDSKVFNTFSNAEFIKYKADINHVAQTEIPSDHWTTSVISEDNALDDYSSPIIADSPNNVKIYLDYIRMIWQPGIKKIDWSSETWSDIE